jgi:hypothetical protein
VRFEGILRKRSPAVTEEVLMTAPIAILVLLKMSVKGLFHAHANYATIANIAENFVPPTAKKFARN